MGWQSLEDIEQAPTPQHSQALGPLVHPLLHGKEAVVQLCDEGGITLCDHSDGPEKDHVGIHHIVDRLIQYLGMNTLAGCWFQQASIQIILQ